MGDVTLFFRENGFYSGTSCRSMEKDEDVGEGERHGDFV